jgi:secreted trypsin-like serine protease
MKDVLMHVFLAPLVSTKNGRFTLAGIVSAGMDFCEKDVDNEKFYGIYTNVANYVEWIKQNSDYMSCEYSEFAFPIAF